MLTIGLTGGIATGKSTVAALLVARGAALVDADVIAREVVEPGTAGLNAVAAAFGPEALTAAGTLDRERLAAVVFADPESRRRLEAITHPLIRAGIAARVAQAVASGPPLVVVDIPLLIEGGREGDFPDGILLVYAEAAIQVERLCRRDGLTNDDALRRMNAQLPVERKRRVATWVIDNGGSVEQTRGRVARWWRDTVG